MLASEKIMAQIFKKVIVSDIGELVRDTRIIGDIIRYRIYYARATLTQEIKKISDPYDIIITDKLDEGLSKIKVFNNGHYDPITRTVTWTIMGRLPNRNAFVEFEAEIASSRMIRNYAIISSIGPRKGMIDVLGKTNIVEISVETPPKMGWISFVKDARKGELPRIYMKDETTMGATVRFDIPGVFVYVEKINGITYHHLSIPGWGALTDLGKPELPIAGELIEVPFGVKLTPEILMAETTVLKGYNVFPVQPKRKDSPISPSPFIVDKSTFQTAKDYPSILAAAEDEDIAVIRGHRVVFLKINPIQYNPVTRKITAYPMIEVRLNYDHPAQLKGLDKRIESPAFEELLQASVLNYKNPKRFYKPESKGPEQKTGCDYLIITYDAFYDESDSSNPIVMLSNWKTRKGYRTKVVKVGSITGGNTPEAIRNYIKNAYEQWDPIPSYVLLVGDSDLINAYGGSSHPFPDQPPIQTDLYYATVDGADYFPDIYIGRLPVDRLRQVKDVVDKILAYEQNPPVPQNDAFFDNISLVGLFQDKESIGTEADGRDNRPFIANLESIRQFLLEQGYNVRPIYATNSGFPKDENANLPEVFEDGTSISDDLKYPAYPWNASDEDIVNSFNDGSFLITYDAHGINYGWSNVVFNAKRLHFTNSDLNRLDINYLTPVIFSMTCQTGWFDNETDDDTKGGKTLDDECFGEELLRLPKAGAVAFIGLSRDSSGDYDEFTIFGLHKAIWPAFVPNPHWSEAGSIPVFAPEPLYRMGQILNFAKMYMATRYGPDDDRKIEFEMVHLFGDPEMPIWTHAPGDLKVDHPAGTGPGPADSQEFVVLVLDASDNPVCNATVVLTRDDTIEQIQQTNTMGVALFKFEHTIGGGDIEITVTGIGYRPYMSQLVVKSEGAVLSIDAHDGPEGQVIHIGGKDFLGSESVDLYFGDHLAVTVETDASGEFGQDTLVDIEVPNGYPHGPVNVIAHGRVSDRYATTVFWVRDANPIDLWTYSQFDDLTWSLNPGDNPTWDSPDIQLYDQSGNPVSSNNLTLGETYTIKVNVRNNTAFQASRASVTFYWRNYGAEGPWETFDNMPLHLDVPPGIAIVEKEYTPHVTGHICIRAKIEHVEDTSPDNNEGQENLHIGYSSSPAKVCFIVWNLTKYPAPVHFEVRQLIQPGHEEERLWATWINHPDPQIIEPGTQAEACVIVDPEVANVKEGTQAEFAVTAFIGRKMIGGVNLIIIKS